MGMSPSSASPAPDVSLNDRIQMLRDREVPEEKIQERLSALGLSQPSGPPAEFSEPPEERELTQWDIPEDAVSLEDQAYQEMQQKDVNQLVVDSNVILRRSLGELTQLGGLVSPQLELEGISYGNALNRRTKDILDQAGLTTRIVADESLPGSSIAPTTLQYHNGSVWVDADPSMWDTVTSQVGEIGLGIAGGIRGMATAGKAATELTAPLKLPPRAQAAVTGTAAVVGGMLGGAAGAAAGRGLDMLQAAHQSNLDVKGSLYLNRMLDSGYADSVYGVLGSLGVQGIKMTAKSVRFLRDALSISRNIIQPIEMRKALITLGKRYNLSDAQMKEMTDAWVKRVGEVNVKGLSDSQKTLQAVLETHPQQGDLLRKAISATEDGGAAMVHNIKLRADSFNELLESGNVADAVQRGLSDYEQAVKDGFEAVKHAATSRVSPSYRFDLQEDILDDALEGLEGYVSDPYVAGKVSDFLQRLSRFGVRATRERLEKLGVPLQGLSAEDAAQLVENNNPLRTFENLLEFRKEVNTFRGQPFVAKLTRKGGNIFDGLISRIDNQIKLATDSLPDAPEWRKSWKAANTEYSNMLKFRETSLAKSLIAVKDNTDAVVSAFTEKGVSGVEWMQALRRLPPTTRRNVETAIIDSYTKKASTTLHHAAGDTGGTAIDFAALDKSLEGINFTSKKAKDLRRVVKEFGKTFANDVDIVKAAGRASPEKASGGVGDTFLGKLKMFAVTRMFRWVSTVLPGQSEYALIRNAGELLENPMNAKLTKSVMDGFDNDPEIVSAFSQLRKEFAAMGEKEFYQRTQTGVNLSTVPLYPVAKNRYVTDKALATRATKLSTKPVRVLADRIVPAEEVRSLLNMTRELTRKDMKNPVIIQKLKELDKGGVSYGKQVVLFD